LGLWNDERSWCKDKNTISATALAYFEKIYTSYSPHGILEVTNTIPTQVAEEINADLTNIFTKEEVTRAL